MTTAQINQQIARLEQRRRRTSFTGTGRQRISNQIVALRRMAAQNEAS